jgi:hypothetical protein
MDKENKMLDLYLPYHIEFFWMREHVNPSISQVSFNLTSSRSPIELYVSLASFYIS